MTAAAGGLGQVAGVVGVERAQPPGRGERELTGALAGQPAGPEVESVWSQQICRRSRPTTRSAVPRAERSPAACRSARATKATPTTTRAPVDGARAVHGGEANDRRREPTPTAWTTMATALKAARTRATTPARRTDGTGRQFGPRGPGRPGARWSGPGRGRSGHESKCRVLHHDRLPDRGPPRRRGGRCVCIFAGGRRADPIGQVGDDGCAHRVEARRRRRRSR